MSGRDRGLELHDVDVPLVRTIELRSIQRKLARNERTFDSKKGPFLLQRDA